MTRTERKMLRTRVNGKEKNQIGLRRRSKRMTDHRRHSSLDMEMRLLAMMRVKVVTKTKMMMMRHLRAMSRRKMRRQVIKT